MLASYNGYTSKQRNAIIGEIKRLRRSGAQDALAYLDSKGPCEICGDPGDPTHPEIPSHEWHSEDYSRPYSFAPPETFIVCTVCHARLHKRFPDSFGKPSDWDVFLAHLRSGGYGREFTSFPLKLRRIWQAQIEARSPIILESRRPRELTGDEWWQKLTLDPESLNAAWARPRPWHPRPPMHVYRAALEQVQPTKAELALVKFHAAAPRRCATMRELARGALSSNSPSQSNLMYGRLAHRLAVAMDWRPPEKRRDGSIIWMGAVAEGWQPANREFEWVMVPTLATLFLDGTAVRN